MARPASKMRATYQDVVDAPEHLVAEILGGELVLTPRPAPPHALASRRLVRCLRAVRGCGGGPVAGSLAEPELHFPPRASRFSSRTSRVGARTLARDAEDGAFTWPPTGSARSCRRARRDRSLAKMAIYAREGVGHLWLLDPGAGGSRPTGLRGGGWQACEPRRGPGVRAEPFEAVALDLANLWKW